jgi:hypothetical protein
VRDLQVYSRWDLFLLTSKRSDMRDIRLLCGMKAADRVERQYCVPTTRSVWRGGAPDGRSPRPVWGEGQA